MAENSEDPTIRIDLGIACLCAAIWLHVHVTVITNLHSRYYMMHLWIFVGIFSKFQGVVT